MNVRFARWLYSRLSSRRRSWDRRAGNVGWLDGGSGRRDGQTGGGVRSRGRELPRIDLGAGIRWPAKADILVGWIRTITGTAVFGTLVASGSARLSELAWITGQPVLPCNDKGRGTDQLQLCARWRRRERQRRFAT